MAQEQLNRSKLLFSKGAIALKELEVVQQEEEKADVAVETAIERLQVLGADKACKTAGAPDHLIAERLALTIAGRARRLGL